MSSTVQSDAPLEGHDAEQIRLMEERCIVTDNDDNMLRDGSKKECTFPWLIQRRSFDGQYQSGPAAPRLFCVPV